MALDGVLWCIGVLLATSIAGVAAARRRAGTTLVYTVALGASTLALSLAALRLLDGKASPDELLLPLGLPWVGVHLRLDALAAFFLVVVNLGGATASLYGLGYGRHEESPGRVLPFFPAFLLVLKLTRLSLIANSGGVSRVLAVAVA